MKGSLAAWTLLCCVPFAYGDAYSSLLHRYEKQIRQQEQQLGNLRGRLQQKELDVVRWKNKAGEAKTAWTEASAALEQTRTKVKIVHDKRMQVSVQADAAQWKTTESVLISRSAAVQARLLAQDLYAKALLGTAGTEEAEQANAREFILPRISELSANSQKLAEESQKEEAALRTDEMRWQTEEQARSEEANRLHQKQEGHWLKWQEALRRKIALEDEISEIDQSAKALQVMLQELRDHRDQA
jgi:hypothetical protein